MEDAWAGARGTPSATGTLVWPDPKEAAPKIREWHFPGKARSRYKAGLAVWASPAAAVVDGRPMAFVGGYGQTMYAMDLAEKKIRWSWITNGEIASGPAVGWVGEEQAVFWGSADRTLYAHFASTGARLWERELVRPTGSMSGAEISSPLLYADRLYVTCFAYDRALARNEQKGWLFALDKRTGGVLWKLEVSRGPLGSPAGRTIGGRFIAFVATRDGLLQAFDLSAGGPRRLWSFQMPHEVLGSPAIEEGTETPLLFLGSKFGSLIAIDALSGRERWRRMAGNWIDNGACVGEIHGERVVFVGSHDYCLYAFRSADGELIWRRRLGGEVYSAPSFLHLPDRPAVAVAALDNHVYVLDARDGNIISAYYTGSPIWDKVSKGDTVWGSPVALEALAQSALIHGSFNNTVYVIPLVGECSLRALTRSQTSLWYGMGAVAAIFFGVLLPVILRLPARRGAA